MKKLIVERIIKNTNEKNLINREEIASESIQNGNISLMIVEKGSIIMSKGNKHTAEEKLILLSLNFLDISALLKLQLFFYTFILAYNWILLFL